VLTFSSSGNGMSSAGLAANGTVATNLPAGSYNITARRADTGAMVTRTIVVPPGGRINWTIRDSDFPSR
jgi:hypothetical protein